MGFGWFALAGFFLAVYLGNTLYIKELYIGAFHFFICAGLCIFLLSDYFLYEKFNPIKTAIISILSALSIVYSLDPQAIINYDTSSGHQIYYTNGMYATITSLFIIYVAFLFLYMNIRILLNAPINLKKPIYIISLGSVFTCVITPLLIFFQVFFYIPGIDAITFSIGFFLISTQFAKHPTILFLLPFRVIRLDVIHNKSGVGLFTHYWEKKAEFSETLYSGMIHAVRGIIDETIKRGEIQEIKLENAIIILRHSIKFKGLYVLVSTKSSKILRDAFDQFVSAFERKFGNSIDNITDISSLYSAKEFITQYFSFVPQFDFTPVKQDN
jgi:hypothetical protein